MASKIGLFNLLLILVVGALVVTTASQTCPSICTCKWKNGKRWVECVRQNQISIPDEIDMETQVLDLSGNNLQILPREVFARHGLLNLQKLHLSDCKIGQIDPTAFRGLTNLVELNLAGNLLTSIPTATFSDIPYLRSLHLERNPLQKVESNAFEMIPQLVSLDLSNCNIKRVAARAFTQLTSLEKLFLQHNHIAELRQKTIESIKGLHAIELANNPWSCDCRLRPLKHWLVSNNVPHSQDPKCHSPPRLAGQLFANLQVDEFACPPELLSAPRYVEANAGDNATLSCKIGSVPSSKVRWYRDGTEVLNNSLVNAGLQRFVIYESGSFEKTSSLILTNARAEDSGPFMCVSQNQAGRVEANFTLQVGYFVGGVASLESGEIAGIAVTLSAIAIVLLVLLLVFFVRQRNSCSTLILRRKPTPNVMEKANGHIHQTLKENGNSPGRISPLDQEENNVNRGLQHPRFATSAQATITNLSSPTQPSAASTVGGVALANGNVLVNGGPSGPDLLHHQVSQSSSNMGSPMTRHSYVNQAVNFSPAHHHFSTLQHQRQIVRASPSQRLESDQLYPEDYSYHGGGYFNPLESSTPMQTRNSPLFRSSQVSGHQATLPRANAGMYQAVNPLKDYGYPSDYGLPMTSLTSSNGFITANPLSEFDEDLEAASELASQQQLAQPQTSSRLQMNLSHSSTGTNSDGTTSTLSPQSRATLTGGQLSSSGIGGDLSAASGNGGGLYRGSPALTASSTPTPPGSSGSSSAHAPHNGLYAKVNKKPFVNRGAAVSHPAAVNNNGMLVVNSSSKRESPDEGIQDDVSTDV